MKRSTVNRLQQRRLKQAQEMARAAVAARAEAIKEEQNALERSARLRALGRSFLYGP